MRFSTTYTLFLTVLLFAVLLTPGPALAASEARNCRAEPTQNMRIASGYVLAGSNCVLSSGADLDSFQFNANNGDTYQMAAAMDGGTTSGNLCLELYDPNQQANGKWCTDRAHFAWAILANVKLTVEGLYTMVLSESLGTDTNMIYDLSLRRLDPPGADGKPIVIGQQISDEINPATDSDIFTFQGVTTGTYRITVALVGTGNVCAQVYRPDGTTFPARCTDSAHFATSFQMDVTPLQNGTHVLLVYEPSWTATVGYTLNMACLLGNCGVGPVCTLKDTLAYDAPSSTLTMNFAIGNRSATTWNAWLTYQNTMQLLWSESQPKTDPPATVTKTHANLAKVGKVGVISTLTTPAKGIICSNWTSIDTGTP